MKYRTIVADPPWEYRDGTGVKIDIGYRDKRRPLSGPAITTRPPFPMLSVGEIKALPIGELAERDAHLYLWTTNRYLREVWGVAEAWGFSVSSILVWCKSAPGFLGGGTFPSNVEFCAFCRRGSLRALGRAESRWFHLPRRVGPPVSEGKSRQTMHSAKPEAWLDLVESVSPGPYLELFARRQRLGWDTWGDEALQHVDLQAATGTES